MERCSQNRKTKSVTGLEKYPMNIRQAICLLAGIVRRIADKRLDKEAQERLINTATEGVVKQ